MLGYGLYQEQALGAVAGTIGRGLASAGRAVLGGLEAAAPEIAEGALIAALLPGKNVSNKKLPESFGNQVDGCRGQRRPFRH